jgi:gamma-glutamylcyclotransferase (GGCT)/AIG2-like uncharacterized protein YtfP
MIFFVYGTLKKSFHNHYLLHKAKFLGNHTTESVYTLFDGGFPIVCRNGNTAIKGELYQTDDQKIINSVNALEGHFGPDNIDNWYDVDTIKTEHGDANIFVMNNCNRPFTIESGFWPNQDDRQHI